MTDLPTRLNAEDVADYWDRLDAYLAALGEALTPPPTDTPWRAAFRGVPSDEETP